MKKRITALMFCVTLALAGCGSTSSGNVAATEPKEIAAVADVSATEPEKVEEPKVETPKVEEVKKPEETEKAEEPKEESTEATETETASEPKETEVVEVAKTDETAGAANEAVVTETVQQEAEPAYNTIIEKYIADGDFTDFAAYGAEIGATKVWLSPNEWNIEFWFDNFIITVGTNVQDPEWTYIGTERLSDGVMEYATLITYKDVSTIPVTSSGTFIAVDTAMKLEQVINYMKQHPDVTQKPDIPGMTWQKWSDLVG